MEIRQYDSGLTGGFDDYATAATFEALDPDDGRPNSLDGLTKEGGGVGAGVAAREIVSAEAGSASNVA